jgi:hypothetical protein
MELSQDVHVSEKDVLCAACLDLPFVSLALQQCEPQKSRSLSFSPISFQTFTPYCLSLFPSLDLRPAPIVLFTDYDCLRLLPVCGHAFRFRIACIGV